MITIVEPSAVNLTPTNEVLRIPSQLEQAGRVCYKSEDLITGVSADKFVRMICRNHHESVLEHCSLSARIVCSRACSHQIVRHRLASYSQESQRYVNYNQKGFQFICPPSVGLKPGEYDREYDDWFLYPGKILIPETRRSEWLDSVASSSQAYQMDIITGGKPEDARYLLPNASKTEIVVTLNLRMWRHVFRERALNPKAQWEIRGIFLTLYELYDDYLPCVFGDLKNENV